MIINHKYFEKEVFENQWFDRIFALNNRNF